MEVAARLHVQATLRPRVLSSGAREGHAGAECLLPAFIRARTAEAGAEAKLSGGVCLPPRAIRNGKRSLRS